MAKFDMQLPKDIMKDIEYINNNTDNIFGQMTKAGAETVRTNVKTNIPRSFVSSNIMNCLKITKIYKTPSDGGINTKVGFYGYFINEKGVETPAPLVANVFEYGSSKFTKRPFFRKSFKKAQIEKAMLEAQKQYSKGILSDE
jgi:hypothetical protein